MMAMMLAVAAVAQEENRFTIDAQLRTRGEYNNGAIYPRGEGQKPATFINEHARLTKARAVPLTRFMALTISSMVPWTISMPADWDLTCWIFRLGWSSRLQRRPA